MSGTIAPAALSVADAAAFLHREARLLDERRLDDWLELFDESALYWVPIDDVPLADAGLSTSLIYDLDVRRRERVYRLLHTPLPSQTPPSRTIHAVSNVEVTDPTPGSGADVAVRSVQTIHEMRLGDHTQRGLGEPRTFVALGLHELRSVSGTWRIKVKKLLLIDRDASIPNLTFML